MKYLTYLAACFAFVLSSCQKEYTFTEPSQQQQTQGDSIYLSRYVILDTTQVAPNDTLAVLEFQYDQLKRNIGIIGKEYIAGVADITLRYNFLYNGSDTLPHKWTSEEFSPGNPPDRDTSYCRFSQGKLVYDSSIYRYQQSAPLISKNILVRNISYYSNRMVISSTNTTFYFAGQLSTDTTTETFYFQTLNGNVIKQIDTSLFSTIREISFSYDAGANPFLRTQAPLVLGEYPWYDIIISEVLNFGRNNFLEGIAKEDGRVVYHMRFENEYNQKGQLKAVRARDLLFPSDSYKGVLTYSKF
jgi:hypothetical protein